MVGMMATWAVDLALDRSVPLNELETKATWELARRFPPAPADPALLLIGVDEPSALKQGLANGTDRLDRRVYGRLIEGLAEAGATVVLSDILFRQERPVDGELAAMITRATASERMKVILTAGNAEVGRDPSEPDGFRYVFELSPKLKDLGERVQVGQAVNFSQEGLSLGGVAWRLDAETQEKRWLTALLAAWAHLRLDPAEAKVSGDRLRVGPWEAQLGGSLDLRLLWTENRLDFPLVSLAEAQEDLAAKRYDRYQNRLIVLADLRGQDTAEVEGKGSVPGAYVVANLVNTALLPASERMRWPSHGQEFGWVALGACLAALAARRGGAMGAVGAPAVALLWGLGLPLAVASLERYVLSAVWAGAAVGLAAVVGLASQAWVARPVDGRVEGELMEATVLFSDLSNSTGLVQQLGAREYQRVYAEWLRQCESIALRQGGLLERTTGDGFLIVFPHRKGSAAPACLAAVSEMIALPGASASFGFESGPVSGGYVREGGRKVWSSSGTTVNMAKRLQSLAGEEGRSCVVGPAAARLLSETARFERLGMRSLKGLDGPVDAYALPREG